MRVLRFSWLTRANRAQAVFDCDCGAWSTLAFQPEILDSKTGIANPVCTDCGETFQRGAGELKSRRGVGMAPSSRCPACRERRRDEHNARVLDYLRTGNVREAQPSSPGTIDAAERLYPAICSACQRTIRLPFKPRLDRAVYCRFCHEARNGR
jgi:CxxC-x17-CxxC domain-containing protein